MLLDAAAAALVGELDVNPDAGLNAFAAEMSRASAAVLKRLIVGLLSEG
jgi:hypothetical protein